MKSTISNVLLAATRAHRLQPVDVNGHRDFRRADIARATREIEHSAAGPGDALIVEEGAPVECMPLCDLLTLLRGDRLDSLATEVERTFVPPGCVVALIIGDEAIRVRTMKVPAQPIAAPWCSALLLTPPPPKEPIS